MYRLSAISGGGHHFSSSSRSLFVQRHALGQGYGTSEIQFGHALKKHDRSLFILQTKAAPNEDPKLFREGLELSFKKLQVRVLPSGCLPEAKLVFLCWKWEP